MEHKYRVGDIISCKGNEYVYDNHSDAFNELKMNYPIKGLDSRALTCEIFGIMYNKYAQDYMYACKAVNDKHVHFLISEEGINLVDNPEYEKVTLQYLLNKYPKVREELAEFVSNKTQDIIESDKARSYWKNKFKDEHNKHTKGLLQVQKSKYIKTGNNKTRQ